MRIFATKCMVNSICDGANSVFFCQNLQFTFGEHPGIMVVRSNPQRVDYNAHGIIIHLLSKAESPCREIGP